MKTALYKALKYVAFPTALVGAGIFIGFTIRQIYADPHARDATNVAKIDEVIRYIKDYYFQVPDEKKMIDDAIVGMLNGLDPHTFYIPAEDLKQVNEQMQGSFEGIGVEFSIVDDTLLVVAPIAGGPSERLGIESGDRIVKINSENVAGIGITNQEVMKRLRGPKGTHVKVSIKRQGEKELLEFDIERDKIPIYSVDYSYMVNKETGYIKVSRFAETTMTEFLEHLNKLKSKGMQNLILDLRGNPGGYLERAKQMADVFLSDGKLIVYTEGRTAGTNKKYHATNLLNEFEQGGLIVLINQGSASASEIVSGAVQDWDRGLVIGTRSFGKGLVQQQYTLSDQSAIRVVVSRYFTPSGRCIQKPYDKGGKEYEKEILERWESGEIFDETKIKLPDSLKYKTNAGRTVYGGGGIIPDVFAAPDTSGGSKYFNSLRQKALFNKFAFRYSEQHPEIKARFKDGFDYAANFYVSDELLNEFVKFASEKGVAYNESDFNKSKKLIAQNVKMQLGRTYFGDDGMYPVWLENDNVFQKALSYMDRAKKLEKTGKF
ncbi:MAG: S41 family peptidase [Bacteroidia bacterium]|nr:S41 family peptidase [Bacteroidia bacterium]MDW8333027.1 S41 family peptidase [Bacteroidia bacterium]